MPWLAQVIQVQGKIKQKSETLFYTFLFLLLILARVNTYLGKFQLDLKNHIKQSFCIWDLHAYIYNDFFNTGM